MAVAVKGVMDRGVDLVVETVLVVGGEVEVGGVRHQEEGEGGAEGEVMHLEEGEGEAEGEVMRLEVEVVEVVVGVNLEVEVAMPPVVQSWGDA